MEEIYRIIVGYENYEVSNFGNVKNIKTKRILKHGFGSCGYKKVDLSIDGSPITLRIHKLVAQTFLENPENKKCIDHIDNNKSNNNVLNLRYATHSENGQNSSLSSKNTSGTKGVSYENKNNKWRARIMIDGINVHLGYFENKEDAIAARILKANQAFGIYVNSCEKINEI